MDNKYLLSFICNLSMGTVLEVLFEFRGLHTSRRRALLAYAVKKTPANNIRSFSAVAPRYSFIIITINTPPYNTFICTFIIYARIVKQIELKNETFRQHQWLGISSWPVVVSELRKSFWMRSFFCLFVDRAAHLVSGVRFTTIRTFRF